MVEVMTSLGFTVSNADEALYYKFNSDGSYLIVGSATDDFTIVTDSNTTANNFLDDLGKQVELVRLGDITWLLGTTCYAPTSLIHHGSLLPVIRSRYGLVS
jgi:hypothetical protein